MAIRIDKVSVTPGEHVGVDLILGDDFHARPAEIRFTVLAIDDMTTMWRTTVVAGVIIETLHGWSGELDTSWLQEGELCELSRAELIGGGGEYVLAVVESGPHERALFEGRSADATPRPAEAVVAAVREVEDRRRLREAEPLSAPGPGPMHAFRVLLFVERLLLRSVLRVPGMQLVPLAHGNVSRDEAFIINRALRELGWQAAVDPQWWAEHSNEAKPMELLRADRVLAPDHTAALVAASDVLITCSTF